MKLYKRSRGLSARLAEAQRLLAERDRENAALKAALARAGLTATPPITPQAPTPSTWAQTGSGTLTPSVPALPPHKPRPPRPPRTPGLSEASRRFIKNSLLSGTSARAVRETHNVLASVTPDEAVRRWGWSAKKVAGSRPVTAKEVHQIQSAMSKRERAERKANRDRMRIRMEADQREAQILGLTPPTSNYQKAHDAGVLFRATNEEHYRHDFEEGSP